MNKERFSQIVDEVYQKYTTKYMGHEDIPSKDLFLFEIKKNKEFSERWGLGIEERNLNLDERAKLHSNPENFYEVHGTFSISDSIENSNFPDKDWLHEQFDNSGIPTKLTTLTYNNETIESYE
jgi:hypothetical protein